MRILFIASNPSAEKDLSLDREISALQSRLMSASGEPVHFAFVHEASVQDLPKHLSDFKPDVVHITAHGDRDTLAFVSKSPGGREQTVRVDADFLRNIFPPDHPPQLVYLNACNSERIARDLAKRMLVPMAVGTSASITNSAARCAAVAFYERLLAGYSVSEAFEICRSMLLGFSRRKATAILHVKPGYDASTSFLHPAPSIVCQFDELPARPDRDGQYWLRFGLRGCAPSTTQVSFVTDDASFIIDESKYERDLSLIVRDVVVHGHIWADEDEWSWSANGDHRIAAIGLKAGGGCFAVESTLCEALERFYRSSGNRVPSTVEKALRDLRLNDGSEKLARAPKPRAKAKTKRKARKTKGASATASRRTHSR